MYSTTAGIIQPLETDDRASQPGTANENGADQLDASGGQADFCPDHNYYDPEDEDGRCRDCGSLLDEDEIANGDGLCSYHGWGVEKSLVE